MGKTRFRVRLAWLVDSELEHLLTWAYGLTEGRPVCVHTAAGEVLVHGASLSERDGPRWNRLTPYERLYAEASDTARTFLMKFCSPTCLSRAGQALPLPDPAGVFLAYLRAWEAFSGIPLAPGARKAVARELALLDYRLRTCRVREDDGALVPGFMGSATFRLQGRHPESVLKAVNVLADYAFFCGTGIGTEKGMGLTRRIGEQGGCPVWETRPQENHVLG